MGETIERAFSPWILVRLLSRGFTPGCDGAGLWPLGVSLDRFPGALPQAVMERAFGPGRDCGRIACMSGLAVVTVSDRCSAGLQVDTAGPAVVRLLEQVWPGQSIGRGLVPDHQDAIATLLHELCHQEYALILTAGGTGLGPRDVTPEATRRLIDREVPGLAEAMRAGCAPSFRFAWLSRAVAGLRGKTLIVNLPGSERGAVECLQAILPLLPHALDVVAGGGAHPAG